MAPVLFIIRVPYEESSKILEIEDKDIREKADHQNVNKVKFENENEANRSGDTNEAEQTTNDFEILNGPLNLAEVLQNELRSLNVQGDSWTVTIDKKFYQVLFLEKTVKRVESILERLTAIGIGNRPESSVSIIPTSVHIQLKQNENVTENRPRRDSLCNTLTTNDENRPLLTCEKEEKKSKDQFKKSVKSRLTVEQIVEGIETDAVLTFDFVMFTILASFITAVGLAEDSAVVLSASILVSPLMGPILGVTFGFVIKNKALRDTGLKTELYGLIVSATVGFFFGIICGLLGTSWKSENGMWPTQEMANRGTTRSLWVGVLITLPSGAGVALSVLRGSTSSLVGVAVSASLLSPAVNFGMLSVYSIISAIKPPELLNSSDEYNTTMSKCPSFKDNSYKTIYSCDMGKEAAILAVFSLVLTIVNTMCILITATVVLKIKEVAPKASSSNATQIFWTKDIKIARDAYKTRKGKQATKFLNEWKEYQGSKTVDKTTELLKIVEQVEDGDDYQTVVRRAQRGAQNLHQVSRQIKRLVSLEDGDEDMENHLKTLQTYYTTQQTMGISKQPHVGKIFSQPEPEPEPEPAQEIKPKKSVREFHVFETENPHHTAIVRVIPPTDESDAYSVTTESGV